MVKIGAQQIGIGEVRVLDVAVGEVDASQACIGEVGARTDEISVEQQPVGGQRRRLAAVYRAGRRVAQDGAGQLVAAEIVVRQSGVSEVGAGDGHRGRRTRPLCCRGVRSVGQDRAREVR